MLFFLQKIYYKKMVQVIQKNTGRLFCQKKPLVKKQERNSTKLINKNLKFFPVFALFDFSLFSVFFSFCIFGCIARKFSSQLDIN